METFEEYLIPIKGLDSGIHLFDFNLKDDFFAEFEDSPIREADLKVMVVLDKRETMLLWAFEITGTIQTNCDRCMEEISLPIHASHDLVVKYGPEGEKGDVVYISEGEPSFQLASYLYEFSCLSIPMVKTYNCESENPRPCNLEVLERLEGDSEESNGQHQSLGEQLKNLGLKPEK
jgi:uncharacterized metal-binding protein YceD (DUF177 family)